VPRPLKLIVRGHRYGTTSVLACWYTVTPTSKKLLPRIIGVILVVAALWLALRATWYVARLPDSNCIRHSVSETRSTDPQYSATLTEKNCNVGETLFYSVTIVTPGGVIRDLPLESDLMRPPSPTLRWVDPHTLGVTVSTGTLSGVLTEHWADGLTLVRTFVAGTKEQ
jgi:hypothetical protein